MEGGVAVNDDVLFPLSLDLGIKGVISGIEVVKQLTDCLWNFVRCDHRAEAAGQEEHEQNSNHFHYFVAFFAVNPGSSP